LHATGLLREQVAKIVCLDRQTGRQNWIFSPVQLADENLKKVIFDGSPLVVGDNVYVGGHDDKPNGYEDAYVLCLDLSTGAYRWSCYVSGAASSSPEVLSAINQNLMFDVASHLSYAGGRVFVSTNLGAVAALDAYGGTVDWLHIYRDDSDNVGAATMPPFMRRGFGGFVNNVPPSAFNLTKPWTVNAPIVHDGNLFVLPTDGKYILVYDCGDGRLIKKIKKSDCYRSVLDDTDPAVNPATPDVLLGVLDNVTVVDQNKPRAVDLLLLGTPGHIIAIKWREYDENHSDNLIAWETSNLTGDAIRGRSFLTADSVYMPTAQKLYRVAIRTGSMLEEYPPEGSWPAGQGSGNVTICQDEVVVAGDQRVSVYADLALVRKNLDQEVAENPSDPAARLRYAEVMFVANQPQIAAQKLDEAIKLLDQSGDRAAGERAFTDAITFAMRSWHDRAAADQVNTLFDRAAALAKEPSQKVTYRLYRARFAQLGQHDLDAAINLYQGILAENALRTAAAADERLEDPRAFPSADAVNPDDAADQSQGGLVAEKAIALLQQDPKGRDAYQPFEKAAKSQMSVAGRAGDADALLAVADMYPNSSQADLARRAAADAYEAKGAYPQATRVLRSLYDGVNDNAQKIQLLQRLAADYLNIPGRLEAAVGRLDVARKLDAAALVTVSLHLPDGNVITKIPMQQADDTVAAFLAAGGPAPYLPNFGMPSNVAKRQYLAQHNKQLDPFLPETPGSAIANVEALLSPSQDFARYDRVATWTHDGGVTIFPVGQTKPLGNDGDLADPPRGAAWVDGRSDLLAWTGGSLALIQGDQVKTKWKLDLNSLPGVTVVAQSAPHEDVSLIVPSNYRGGRRGFGGGGRARLNFNPYQTQFQVLPLSSASAGTDDSSAAIAAAAAAGEQVATVVVTSKVSLFTTNLGRVVAVDLSDGAILWQCRVVDHPLDRLLATDDFTVIKTHDDIAARLVVFDTFTGKLIGNRVMTVDPTLGDDTSVNPNNVALGDDGTLAYTLDQQVVIRDLYDCGHDPKMQRLDIHTDDMSGIGRAYQDMTRPDQLLVHARQVLAVAQSGRIVCVFSAETGQLREFRKAQAGGPRLLPMNLPTGSGTNDTIIRIGGPYIYAWGNSSLVGYNLDNPDIHWEPVALHGANGEREMFMGKDYLLVMNEPPPGEAVPSWQMSAFSRLLVAQNPPDESGLLVYQREIKNPAGITAWQPVDGGLVYLAGDRTLHFLRGGASAGE
jgi:outer membrane protein assembly factor BamB